MAIADKMSGVTEMDVLTGNNNVRLFVDDWRGSKFISKKESYLSKHISLLRYFGQL